MAKRTFRVIEHCDGFELEHVPSGRRHWLSDGVDVLFTPTGRPVSPGCKTFRARWEREFNESECETMEAYFPDLLEED